MDRVLSTGAEPEGVAALGEPADLAGTASTEPTLLGHAVTATVVIKAPAAIAGAATRTTRTPSGA
ncbi:hypothetical protein GCM10022204_22870 [Microlunatus aurantiacus]|uniref:Uncharacterized protein n=1 Tax=Microlunatus aurantiacus TaxID=446786 RepID=A0ABP7DF93_9ACTN